MIWLFLLLSFLNLGRILPVLGQQTEGMLVKYKDGKIQELVNAKKMVMTMSGSGGEDNILYTQPNYKYKQYEISESDNKWFLEKIGVKEANDILSGVSKQTVIVAIIDSGVDYNNTFLASKMWDGTNCVDEYGQSLGNCKSGYDFENKDKDPLPEGSLSVDKTYHGTHIAGIIGMIGDNVKIMALKSKLTSSEITRAIMFAKKNGAKIINASWGSEYEEESGYPAVSDRAMYEAISGFDGIFVNAAGNDGISHDCGDDTCIPFPAILKNKTSMGVGLKNIVVVAASDQSDKIASFSNYGKTNVDLAAPGVDIYSTVGNNTYKYYSGTSMATPMVAGAMGYVWGWKNSMTREQLIDYVINNGQKLDSMTGFVTSGRRLDLRACVTCSQNADYNRDGVVNGGDYVVWRNVFIDKMTNSGFFADGNCDKKVTIADYSYWREVYSK